MKFLLDTCVLSEVYKPEPMQAVIQWMGTQSTSTLWVSAITFGELQRGAFKLDAGRAQQNLLIWIAGLQDKFKGRTLGFNLDEALLFGQISGRCERQGARLPFADGMLAAIALQHDMTLVTRNIRDFERTGVRIFNPWQE